MIPRDGYEYSLGFAYGDGYGRGAWYGNWYGCGFSWDAGGRRDGDGYGYGENDGLRKGHGFGHVIGGFDGDGFCPSEYDDAIVAVLEEGEKP